MACCVDMSATATAAATAAAATVAATTIVDSAPYRGTWTHATDATRLGTLEYYPATNTMTLSMNSDVWISQPGMKANARTWYVLIHRDTNQPQCMVVSYKDSMMGHMAGTFSSSITDCAGTFSLSQAKTADVTKTLQQKAK